MSVKVKVTKDRTQDIIKNVENSRKTALTGAAMIVHGAAVLLVKVITGNLMGSLAFEVKETEARIGTNVEYAARLEFGFNGTDSLGRSYNQAAQPYLTPALKNNEAGIQKYISSVMKGAMK